MLFFTLAISASPADHYLILQAEWGAISGTGITNGVDANIKYVSVNQPFGNDKLAFLAENPYTNNYEFWIRLKGIAGGKVSLTDSRGVIYTESFQGKTANWHWVKLNGTKKLTPGGYTLTINQFSGTVQIDQIIIKAATAAVSTYQTAFQSGITATGDTSEPILSNGGPWIKDGLKPFSDYLQNGQEYVSTTSANLTVFATDAVIPGRGGLDLTISRYYNSRSFSNEEPVSAYLVGDWDLALPKIQNKLLYFPNGSVCNLNKVFLGQKANGDPDIQLFAYKNTANQYFDMTETRKLSNGVYQPSQYELYLSDGTYWRFGASGKIKSIRTNTASMNFFYDAYDQLVEIWDSAHTGSGTVERIFKLDRTVAGKIIVKELANGITKTLATYNVTSQLNSVTDMANHTTSYHYDGYLLSSIIYPTGKISDYHYNSRSVGDLYLGQTTYAIFWVDWSRTKVTNPDLSETIIKRTEFIPNFSDEMKRRINYVQTREFDYSMSTTTPVTECFYSVSYFGMLSRAKIIDVQNQKVVRTIFYNWDSNNQLTSEEVYAGNIYNADGYDKGITHSVVTSNKLTRSDQYLLSSEKWLYDSYVNLLYHKDSEEYATYYCYYNGEYTTFTGSANPPSVTFPYNSVVASTIHTLPKGIVEVQKYSDAGKTAIQEMAETYYKYNTSNLLEETKEKTKDADGTVKWIVNQYQYDGFKNCDKFIADVTGQPVTVDYYYDPVNYNAAYLTKITRTISNAVNNDGTFAGTQTVTEEYVYDFSNGNQKSTSLNGNTVTYEYSDPYERCTKIIYPKIVTGDPSTTEDPATYEEVKYHDLDDFKKHSIEVYDGEVGSNRNVTVHRYDSLGRETAVEIYLDASQSNQTDVIKEQKTYNAQDKVIKYTNKENKDTSYGYDCLGRLIRITTPASVPPQPPSNTATPDQITVIAYSDQMIDLTFPDGQIFKGTLITTTVTAGKITRENKVYVNSLGRKIKEIADNNEQKIETYFEYDGFDNLIKTIDGEGHEMGYAYNVLNQLIKVKYPDASGKISSSDLANYTEKRYYDNRGNLNKEVNRNGETIIYSYNEYNQVTTINLPTSDDIIYRYNKIGQLIKVEQGSKFEKIYAYDLRNRRTSETLTVDPASATQQKYTTQYKYNRNNQLKGVVYPKLAGNLVSTLDSLDRTTGVAWNGSNIVSQVKYLEDNSRIDFITYGNGVMAKYGYTYLSGNALPQSINYTLNGQSIKNFNYGYDLFGNVISMNDKAYQYDGLDRLVKWTAYKPAEKSWSGEDVLLDEYMSDSTQGITLNNTIINQGRLQLDALDYTNQGVSKAAKLTDLYTKKGLNYIQNPTFQEYMVGAVGIPAGWLRNHYGTGDTGISTAQDTDKRFGKVAKIDNTILTSANSVSIEGVDIPVTPNTVYRQGGWIKGNGTASIYLGRRWYDSAGNLIGFNYIANAVNPSAWTYYQGTTLSPANAATCRIVMINHNNNTGVAYFDNLYFSEDTGSGYNLMLKNASFEESTLGDTAYPAGWVAGSGFLATQIVADSTDKVGSKVLKISDANLLGSSVSLESVDIPVEGGKTYRQAAWLKGGSGNLSIGHVWYDSNNVKVGTTYIASSVKPTDWSYYEEKVTAPAGAVRCRVVLYCAGFWAFGYFDNLLFMEDFGASELASTNSVVNAGAGLGLTRGSAVIEETFTDDLGIDKSKTTALLVNGTVKLPTNTTALPPFEIQNPNFTITTKNFSIPFAVIDTRAIYGTSVTGPAQVNGGKDYEPADNSSLWRGLTQYSVPESSLIAVKDLQIDIASTVNNVNSSGWGTWSLWLMVKLNNVVVGKVSYTAQEVSTQSVTKVLQTEIASRGIQFTGSPISISLYWLINNWSADGSSPIGSVQINSVKLTALTEESYPVNTVYTATYSIANQLESGKRYKFTASETNPGSGSIGYELYPTVTPSTIITLTNGQIFIAPETGTYALKVSISTQDKGRPPVLKSFSLAEVQPYVANATLCLATRQLPVPCKDINLEVAGENISDNYLKFWVSGDGGNIFVPVTTMVSGKYSVHFAAEEQNVVVKVDLSSDANQSSTPVIDSIKIVGVNGGAYASSGSFTTNNFTVTNQVNRLILEVHGKFNGGTIAPSLKFNTPSGPVIIPGTLMSLNELSASINSLAMSKDVKVNSGELMITAASTPTDLATTLHQESRAKGLTSYYYQFDVPTNLIAPFTGNLICVIQPASDGQASPVVSSYVLMHQFAGYQPTGTFSLTIPTSDYLFDKVKVKVDQTVPAGTTTAYDLVNQILNVPVNEQVVNLTGKTNNLNLTGRLNTTDNRISPEISHIKVTALRDNSFNLDVESLSDLANPTPQVTQDATEHIVGNYSLKFDHTSTGYTDYQIKIAAGERFDVVNLPLIKVWVKPMTANTSISFMTYDVNQKTMEKITSDTDHNGTFVPGRDMVLNQWNLLILDLRNTSGGGIEKAAEGLHFIINYSQGIAYLDGISISPLNEITYDKAGNRLTGIEDNLLTSYQYNSSPNLLTGKSNSREIVSYNYDWNGNMTSQSVNDLVSNVQTYWEYAYNELNQLVRVTKNGQVVEQYYYEENGLRYKKVDSVKNEITIYVYGAGYEPIFEEVYSNLDMTSVPTAVSYLSMGDKRIASADSTGQLTYYITDNLGSTSVTMSGSTVTGTYEYSPWGQVWTENGTAKYKFTGKEADGTGLYYFNARYMNPATGRFISEDPLGQGVNWYVYCLDNPLRYVDCDGNYSHDPKDYKSIFKEKVTNTGPLKFTDEGKINWIKYITERSKEKDLASLALNINNAALTGLKTFVTKGNLMEIGKAAASVAVPLVVVDKLVAYQLSQRNSTLNEIKQIMSTEGVNFSLEKQTTHFISLMNTNLDWVKIGEGDVNRCFVVFTGKGFKEPLKLEVEARTYDMLMGSTTYIKGGK